MGYTMVTLDWTQERKLNGIQRRMANLYAFIHVVMQMDMGYEAKDTKVVLGFIAMKTHALTDKIERLMKKANISASHATYWEIRDGGEVNEHGQAMEWEEAQHLVKMHHRQYESIRHACKLVGIKLKVRYDMDDILNYTNKYKV